MKQYRVIVTLKSPFSEPVEMPYGPAQPSKFSAVAAFIAALDTHADDDRWTALQSIRVDVTNVDHQCGWVNPWSDSGDRGRAQDDHERTCDV